jgi:lysophospholipase L1-like esterase
LRIGLKIFLPAAALCVFLPAIAARAARLASPEDPHLLYTGRFDWRDPAGPRCEWSASSVDLRFRGPSIAIRLRDSGSDDYELVVDQNPSVFHAQAGDQTVHLPADLPAGEHEVTLCKRTEAFVGRGQLLGVELPEGTELLPAQRPTRRIEVIGDSISCGYGNEATDQHVRFSPRSENAWLAYGAIAARSVGAGYVCIAWSGRKMWPDDTIPAIYDLTLPTDPTSTWDFAAAPPPDAVLINLATNDFGRKNPDQADWTAAYEAFVHRVRGHYPKAMIYLAAGTMMSDAYPPGHAAMTTLRRYLRQISSDLQASGETRCRLIDFGTQDAAVDGLGADYHPSLKTHRKMAAQWVNALHADLGWTAPTTQP